MNTGRTLLIVAAMIAAAVFALTSDLQAQCGGGGCGGGGAPGRPGGGCGPNPSGPGCDDGMPKCPSASIGGLPCDSMAATGTMWWVDSPGRPAPLVTAPGDDEQTAKNQDIFEIEKACADLRPVLVYFWKRADPLETDPAKARDAETAACEALDAGLWKVLAVTERARDFACVRVDMRSADAAMLKLHGVSRAPSIAVYDFSMKKAYFNATATVPPAQFAKMLEAAAARAETEIRALAKSAEETPSVARARERVREYDQKRLCIEGLKALDKGNFQLASKKFDEGLALAASGDWADRCAAGRDESGAGAAYAQAEAHYKARRFAQAREILQNISAGFKKATYYGTKASELLQQVYKKTEGK